MDDTFLPSRLDWYTAHALGGLLAARIGLSAEAQKKEIPMYDAAARRRVAKLARQIAEEMTTPVDDEAPTLTLPAVPVESEGGEIG